MDNNSHFFAVPSSVHIMDDEAIVETPRTGNRKSTSKRSSGGGGNEQVDNAAAAAAAYGESIKKNSGEVDAYDNPTELFQWINYGNYQAAAVHALEHPSEVKTWIVSQKRGKKGEQQQTIIKWRYLPLHLACMKSNPSEDLLRALIYSYPAATRERDHDMNLPIHYLLSEGCDHSDIIQMLLKAYPESIDKRDRKGRSLLEIVSEGYRAGKLKKDTMVNMLAILRQWTIRDDNRSVASGNFAQQQQRSREGNGPEEARDAAPPRVSASRSGLTVEEKYEYRRSKSSSRSKRSKSTGHGRPRVHEIFRMAPYEKEDKGEIFRIALNEKGDKKVSREGFEVRLENTLTERDVLRKTVDKLKTESKNQEMALVALNKQVENAALDQQKGREKIKKKKDRIEELQKQLKEKEDRISNQEQTFYDKEHKLQGKDKLLRELSDRIGKLVEENNKLRGNREGENSQLSTRLEQTEEDKSQLSARLEQTEEENSQLSTRLERTEEENSQLSTRLERTEEENSQLSTRLERTEEENSQLSTRLERTEEENQELKQRVDELLRSKTETANSAEARSNTLQLRLNEVEEDLNLLEGKKVDDVHSVRMEALATEKELKSRIKALEREILECSREDKDGNFVRSPDMSLVENERNALKEMNVSLQEHVGALKERCRHLGGAGTERKELEQNIQRLESDLLHARLKQTEYHEGMEHARSESLINESRLQTKLAKLEKELLEAQGKKEAEASASISADDDKSLEERRSLQMMNASLQEHIVALKEKCSTLEKALAEAREKNAKLTEEIRAVRFDDIGERQKELHSEFSNLFNLVQGMANSGTETDPMKNLVNMQSENESLLEEASILKSRFAESQSEIELLHTELHSVRAAYESIKAVPEDSKLEQENEKLRRDQADLKMQVEDANAGSIDNIKTLETQLQALETQLREMSQRADFYKDQLGDVKEKLKMAKSGNSKLRDMITKNNVEQENEKLQRDQAVLKMQVESANAGSIDNIKILETQLREMSQRAAFYKDQLGDVKEKFEMVKSGNSKLRDIISKNNVEQENEKLQRDQAGLKMQIESANAGSFDNTNTLETELREMSQRADFYKDQLGDVKKKFDMVKSGNSKLRDIITKNNATFLAKVDSLTDELDDLRQTNDSLHAHIHDLSVENRGMRKGVSMIDALDNGEEQQRQTEELTARLNHVAGYLIAVSLILEEGNADSEMNKADYGVEAESYFAGLSKDSLRGELREEVVRRQEALLSSGDRDDIVQRANHIGHEMRSGYHRPQAKHLSGQREELNSISAELQHLSQL